MAEVIVHVLRGPDAKRYTGKSKVRWCFDCRAHLLHRDAVLYDSKPSYYSPFLIYECERCGKDRTEFPR